jgi:hypothetical protein
MNNWSSFYPHSGRCLRVNFSFSISDILNILLSWSAQYGAEFRGPWRIETLSMRPIIEADLKSYDQNNWSTDVSARAGVEFEKFQVLRRKLQILAVYYNGYTPSGQFYTDRVKY